jgi:hypothetical protein
MTATQLHEEGVKMPVLLSDTWEFDAGLRQMVEGWSLNQAVLFLILVALCVTFVSVGAAALISLREAHPSH